MPKPIRHNKDTMPDILDVQESHTSTIQEYYNKHITLLEGDQSKPWHKRPNEGDKAYNAFFEYMTLDPGVRSVPLTFEIIRNKRARYAKKYDNAQEYSEGSLSVIRGWAYDYDWKDRAQAYDAYIYELQTRHNARITLEMDETHARAARAAALTLLLPHLALQKKIQDDPGCISELEGKSITVLIDMLKNNVKELERLTQIERRARGLSNSNKSIKQENTHAGRVDIDVNYRKKLTDIQDKLEAGHYK